MRGGLATFDELFCRAFKAQGHDCEIISYSLQYPDFLFPGSTQFDTSGKPPQGITIHTLINSVNPLSWLKTARFIKQQKPDLIIFRYWIPFMGPALGTIARRARKAGIKVMAITDNVIPHEKRPGDVAFTKYFIKSCDGFITMSQAVLTELGQFTDTSHKRFLLHPLYTSFGEKLTKAAAREKLGIAANEKIILFFGLIRKYKGLDVLLEAMADERIRKLGIKLLIAGEFYEDRSYYDDIIKRHKLEEQIILHAGFVANEDVKYYFSATDLVTLTYRSATQSGVTQVAFHFEKPVLVTNVGGLGEIIPHGQCGYVVEFDKAEVANAIVDFYENNREELYTQGMIHEKQKYDWSIFVENVLDLYSKLKV
ncbi:MAG: glycosyltransferase [Bacteroidetes bacterium]|nr:glycosyltransferase [Bacteroidota bacterium]